MRAIRFDVLTLFTESYAVIDSAVENWQICCQMLQQSRLLIGIFRFEELVEFLSWDFERRWNSGNGCENSLVVRPHEEDETNVIEHEEEESFDTRVDVVYAQLYNIGVPTPKIAQKKWAVISIACRAND